MSEKRVKTIAELSREELVQKQQEMQFIGTQYAMNGCEAPEQLTHDYDAVVSELAKRSLSRQ
jgi:hypothetical protein